MEQSRSPGRSARKEQSLCFPRKRNCYFFAEYVWGLQMSNIPSLVRLIPDSRNSEGERQYCVQMLILGESGRWTNIGHVLIVDGRTKWRPLGAYTELMPRIGIEPGGSITGDDKRMAPFVFARYRIDLYLRKIASGELPNDEIVPDVFAVNTCDAEAPWFLQNSSE